ncbi:potassium channel family protein [Clostridium minihomine]|uniref:potassium channel family protein n=1 Tax=Clostridium minihomine TaxID=2045012 RepID=UPI000C76263C|nr:NAD-binding protein [Clostridium minihomine]
MRIVIMGGGKLGYNVARNMLDRKYQVRLIEKEYAKCVKIANDLGVEVICGDGTEIAILEGAATKEADTFIAVTGSDQDNLVAAQLAKMEFGAKKVIVRANNPRNLEVLRTMGADIAVSSTEIITNMIEQEVDMAEMHLLATLNKGRAGICTMVLPKDTSLHGIRLMDVTLPENTLIVSVLRGDQMMIPNGRTVLHSGDQVVAVCENKDQKKLLHALGERLH